MMNKSQENDLCLLFVITEEEKYRKMEENNQNITKEELIKRAKTLESLKKFFESDMRIKQTLLNLAPNQIDDYSEESRIKYADKLYKKLGDIKAEFIDTIQNFEFSPAINKSIEEYFNSVREKFLLSHYEPGTIQKIYSQQFSNMSSKLIEEVKKYCVGYLIDNNLEQLIGKCKSINELLHVMHSYITNNEEILKSLSVIATKKNKQNYNITLYGEENELAEKLFKEFPIDIDCGETEIISLQDKILMMVRDRGHALTIDVDIAKEDHILIKYFIPKLCNKDMIKALPGINASAISENGANGLFETSKEKLSEVLIDFIQKVPTDMDMPILQEIKQSKMKENYKATQVDMKEITFEEESVEELVRSRRIGTLVTFKEKFKNVLNKLRGNTLEKTQEETEGYKDDRTRD